MDRLYPFPLSNGFYTGLIKQPWLPAEAITLTSGQRCGQSNTVIDYIRYPKQIYLEIYHLLFSAENGTGGAGEGPADS